MRNKKPLLIPAAVAEKIVTLRPEDRLLCAVGQFDPKRTHFWYPIQDYFLTTDSIDEANAVFHKLCKSVLRNQGTMRRFCAANPDACREGYWCPTYDFVYIGAVNHYRLRCMLNHGDFNYMLMVYQTKTNENEGKAA